MRTKIAITCAAILLFLIQASPGRNLKILDSQIRSADSKTVVLVEVQNTASHSLVPIVWLDVYDDQNQHVERFKSQRLQIDPGTSTRYWIELTGLNPGTYSGLVVGHYISRSETENVNDTIMLLGNIKPFTLPLDQPNSLGIVKVAEPQPVPDSYIPADQNRDHLAGSPDLYAALRSHVKKLKLDKKRRTELAVDVNQQIAKVETNGIRNTTDTFDKPTDLNKEKYRYYVVKSGDWLSKIAQKFYGDALKFSQIFEANRDVIQDPDLIFPGQKLRIPIAEDGYDFGGANSGE